MVINGFLVQNITSQIDKTSVEVDGLLCAYGLAPGVAEGIRILHTDDWMCDVLMELVATTMNWISLFTRTIRQY